MPGALAIDSSLSAPCVRILRYSADVIDEREDVSPPMIAESIDEHCVTWVDVNGLGDEALLREICEIFNLHPLAVGDVVNVPQRPKAESYGDYVFLVTRMLGDRSSLLIEPEQVSIFLGPQYVLTFQERRGDVFDPLRERIRAGKGRIRRMGADYLAYSLLDAVIDGYYPYLESLGDRLEDLEDEALDHPRVATLKEANHIRSTLSLMRRILWPQREAINSLIRDETPLISDAVRVYLRDAHDHCTQLSDVVESYREVVGAIANTYLSVVSNRTNDVMKVLTIMSSIFIPLTFMVGVYGMNFDHMPELHFRYGYPLLVAAMLAVAAGLLVYFYYLGWIGRTPDDDEDDGGAS